MWCRYGLHPFCKPVEFCLILLAQHTLSSCDKCTKVRQQQYLENSIQIQSVPFSASGLLPSGMLQSLFVPVNISPYFCRKMSCFPACMLEYSGSPLPGPKSLYRMWLLRTLSGILKFRPGKSYDGISNMSKICICSIFGSSDIWWHVFKCSKRIF